MDLKEIISNVSYSDEQMYSIMCCETQKGAFVVHVRGKLCSTLDDFFREISAAMRFPYYFGWNWAAFDECMTDLEWLSFQDILIVIDDFNLLFQNETPAKAYKDMLIKHLNIVAEYWISQNIPFLVYLNQK